MKLPRFPIRRRSRTGSLAALAVILMLLVLAAWLVRVLGSEAAPQDCVSSGSRGCSS